MSNPDKPSGSIATLPAGDQLQQQTEADTHRDRRHLRAYALLLGTYVIGATVSLVALKGRRNYLRGLDVKSLVLLTLATQHLSRLIAKDSITEVVRAPFSSYVESTGEGEVNDEPKGSGLQRVIGELITCPFCLAQWVATVLVFGSLAAPNLTEVVTTTCALARSSDFVQIAYDQLKNHG